jgi:hypothetical protein
MVLCKPLDATKFNLNHEIDLLYSLEIERILVRRRRQFMLYIFFFVFTLMPSLRSV